MDDGERRLAVTRRENVTGHVIYHDYKTGDHSFSENCPANFSSSPPPLSSVFHSASKLLSCNVRVLQPQGQTPQRQGVRFRAAQGKDRLGRERRFQVVSSGGGGRGERSDTEPNVSPADLPPNIKVNNPFRSGNKRDADVR